MCSIRQRRTLVGEYGIRTRIGFISVDQPACGQPVADACFEVFVVRIGESNGRVFRNRDIINVPTVPGNGRVSLEPKTDADIGFSLPLGKINRLFNPVGAGSQSIITPGPRCPVR